MSDRRQGITRSGVQDVNSLTPNTCGYLTDISPRTRLANLTSAMFPQLNHVQHSRLFVSIRGQNSAFDRRCYTPRGQD